MQWRKMWSAGSPRVADFDQIERTFRRALDGTSCGKIADLIRAKMPVRIGSMTDCFTTVERRTGLSLRLLHMLREYDYPYLILTKGSLVAQDAYLKALEPSLAYVQFSVTTPYDEVAERWEPGAPPTSERLMAMSILRAEGIEVAGRICPLIPIYPDGHYSGKHSNAEPLDVFGWHLIDLLAEHGCQTVIAGFLRLNYYNNNRRRITAQLGFDPDYLFMEEVRKQNDALYFSIEEKRYYYEKAQDMAHERDMAFSVCYDGDEAYETFRYLWENPSDCCNAPFAAPRDMFGLGRDNAAVVEA